VVREQQITELELIQIKIKKMNQRITILLILIFGILACDILSEKEYFDKIVYDSYHTKYDGILIEKFIDKNHGSRPIFVLQNEFSDNHRVDFVFQSKKLYDFLKIGDTVFKNRKSISINIKRKGLDTLVNLDFRNLKNHEIYSRENKYLSTD
jgi:hypothetical protein